MIMIHTAQIEPGVQGFHCKKKDSSIFVHCPSSSPLTPFSWWWSACGGTNAEPLVSCQPVAPSRARLGLVFTALVMFRAVFGIKASILCYISTNSDRICFKYLTTQDSWSSMSWQSIWNWHRFVRSAILDLSLSLTLILITTVDHRGLAHHR